LVTLYAIFWENFFDLQTHKLTANNVKTSPISLGLMVLVFD